MSWQAYVDSSLVGTGHVDKGAIVSLAGDSVWAATPGFDVKPAELKQISAALSAGKYDEFYATGLHVAGEKYVLSLTDGTLYARKGREGVAIAKTTQAIIIAHHGEASVAGNTTTTVAALADYLVKAGY